VASALLAAGVQRLRLAHLSVSELPGSGTTGELLSAAGIDAAHIASAAAALVEEGEQRRLTASGLAR
jgi:transketolase